MSSRGRARSVRGQSSAPGAPLRPPAPAPVPFLPATPRYTPAGYDSDSDYSDDDDMGYYRPRPVVQPQLNNRLPVPTAMTVASVTSSSGHNNPSSSSTVTSQFTVHEHDDWSFPGPPGVDSSVGVGPGRVASQPQSQPSSSTFKPSVGISNLTRREEIPMIPDINRARCITANRSINAVWSNGEFGKDKDIYTSGIAKTLRVEFKDAKNPYSTALNIMFYSIDFFKPKYTGSLSLEVMKEFKKWLLDSGGLASFERQYLNPELQKIAFSIIMKQTSVPIIKIVCELYCLKAIASTFIPTINEFCENGNFREACWAATYLGLYTEFDVTKFVIPLIVQGREQMAIDYLMVSVENQEAITDFFDKILGERQPTVAMRNYVFANNIDNAQFQKLEVKPLGKLLDRLRKKFGLGLATCPNSGRRKRMAALRHFMHRKYILNDDMSEAAFDGLLDDTVENDDALLEESLSQFREFGDYTGAAKFALRHAVPLHKITYEIQLAMHEINPNVVPLPDKAIVQQWDEDWDMEVTIQPKSITTSSNITLSVKTERSLTPSLQSCVKPGIYPVVQTVQAQSNSTNVTEPESRVVSRRSPSPTRGVRIPEAQVFDIKNDSSQKFYQIPIPLTKVHLLETPDMIFEFLNELEELQKCETGKEFPMIVIGFDAEWKPLLAAGGVALMQIAIPHKVYLIDIHELKRHEGSSQCWILLLEKFFKNEKILKLGISMMANDVQMLAKTVPAWTNMAKEFKGGVDMSQLALDLYATSPEIFQNYMTGNSGNRFSLSDLVLAFTGYRLKKDEQFSNWESRPLREAQIIYAATDAYCVLDVFKIMKERAESAGINFETTVIRILENWERQANGTIKKAQTKISAQQLLESGSKGIVALPNSPFKTPRSPSEVKFVCDNALAGLARLLRSCGIDTIVIDREEAPLHAADIAVKDDRYIITTRNAYKFLAPYVPAGHCYLLQITGIVVDELRDVLTYFNIVVTNLHLYTRCQMCNNNEFVKIRSNLLQDMYAVKFPRELRHASSKNKISGCIEIYEATIASTSGVGMAVDEQNQRRWILLPENSLVTEGPSDLLRTKRGAVVGVKGIGMGVLDKVEHIYACNNCGKCYWPKSQPKTPASAAAAQSQPKRSIDSDGEDDEAFGYSDYD